MVLEAADQPGGRVRSDLVDGFICDRGFQVFNPWYPTARQLLDYSALDLHQLSASIGIATKAESATPVQRPMKIHYVGDPFRSPTDALSTLRAPLGSWQSLLRLLNYVARVRASSIQNLAARPDLTTQELFDQLKLSKELQANFLKPFLGGVTLDLGLRTSRRFTDFVFKSFASATPCLPARGMSAISQQLASKLQPNTLLLNTRVTKIKQLPERGFIIETQGADGLARWEAGAVVVAVDPPSVKQIMPSGSKLPSNIDRLMKGVTTWYHAINSPRTKLTRGKASLLVYPKNPELMINSVVLTNSVPSYSPDKRALISTSRLGVHESQVVDDEILQLVTHLYALDSNGRRISVKPIARYGVANALPDMTPPFDPSLQQTLTPVPNLFLTGDYTLNGSIEGALRSGQLAAQAVLQASRDTYLSS